MKLLLIDAINTEKRIESVYPPLGLAYLSSYLKRQHPATTVRIANSRIPEVLQDFQPDLVGVSSVSQSFGRATEIAQIVKSSRIPVFVGGVHISMLPQSLPPAFDFGVVGEGEATLVELIDLASGGLPFRHADLECIPGLVLHGDLGVKLTPPRPLIADLDSIPFPDRKLLRIPHGQTTYLFSSRGCPYRCTFCVSSRFWEEVRWFSAEYVVDELQLVVDTYRPWAVSFYDDLFVANLPRLERIVELIKTRGLDRRVKFSFACRANLVNDRLTRLLKQIDTHMICMGLESGCQKSLDFLKAGMTVEQNRLAVERLRRAGITVQATFIIGSPGETEDDIRQTLSFIEHSQLSNFEVYVLTPFPGTPVWDMAKQRGLVSDNMDWAKLAVEIDDSPDDKILLSELPRDRILDLCRLFGGEKRKRRLLLALNQAARNPAWAAKKVAGLLGIDKSG